MELSFWHLICDCEPAAHLPAYKPHLTCDIQHLVSYKHPDFQLQHGLAIDTALPSIPSVTIITCCVVVQFLIGSAMLTPAALRNPSLLTPIPPLTITSKQQPCLRRSRPHRFVVIMLPCLVERTI